MTSLETAIKPEQATDQLPADAVVTLGATGMSGVIEQRDFQGPGSSYGNEVVLHEDLQIAKQFNAAVESPGVTQQTEARQQVREDMAAFAAIPDISQSFDAYFNPRVPVVLHAAKEHAEAEAGKKLGWTAWLAEKADDAQLTNFMQWHNAEHEKLTNNPELAARFTELSKEYKEQVERLAGTNLLHSEVDTATLEPEKIQFRIGDMFIDNMLGILGQMSLDGKTMNLPQNFDSHTVKHEFNHGLLGHYGEYGRDTWIDEALTDHLAHALEAGDEQVVSPVERNEPQDNNGYQRERELLASILRSGKCAIPLELFTQTYSAVSEQARVQSQQRLNNAIVQAYGSADFMQKVTEYVNDTYDMDDDEMVAAMNRIIADPNIVLQ